MSFFTHLLPDEVDKLLNSPGVEKLYRAVNNDEDESLAVMAALELIRKSKLVPKTNKIRKSDDMSSPFRLNGNRSFQAKDYHGALKFYNLAISSAPPNSKAFLLAVSNRASLLQKVRAYSASLQDIEVCLTLDCPPEMLSKLQQRKQECNSMVFREKSKKVKFGRGGADFFNFSVERHPQIPCASTFVDVKKEKSKYKIIAAKDIPAGTMVSLETAFASNLSVKNYCFACHYCHKISLNLISCDTCCDTWFCSIECKDRCNAEFHNIECQLMDLIKRILPSDSFRISLKAALRMKFLCNTWEELIACAKKSTTLTVNELYDANRVQSVMSITPFVNHFVHGQRFNHSFIVATMIHFLHRIPGFFPVGPAKGDAIRTFSRILMHLISLHRQFLPIQDAALAYPKMQVTCEADENLALFSFTNKLTHSCDPNLCVVGHLNKMALVSTKNIKKGTELTISYIGHYYDKNYGETRGSQIVNIRPGCDCRVCKYNWSSATAVDADEELTYEQRQFMGDFIMRSLSADRSASCQKKLYEEACKGLNLLNNLPQTQQYLGLYREFRLILINRQYLASRNEIIVN